MSEVSEVLLSGQFITAGEVLGLLEQCEESKRMEDGSGMSLHWLRHDTRGEIVLVQGSNGNFAVLQAA